MYDFLSGNDLILSDFQFQQSVKYTYFCDKTDVYTWIDHVASAKFDSDNVILFEIVPRAADNVSDHLLPMVCHVKVHAGESLRFLASDWLRTVPGGRLNKKNGLTRYGNSHVKDKTS